MVITRLKLFFLLIPIISSPVFASETLTPEPEANAYNFVTHYRISINASPETVWPVLINLKAWMYEFELSTASGRPGELGQVLNLYEDQDFKIQVISVEPNKMLSIANLPQTFRSEFGTGVGVMTLHKTTAGTEVSLTMSRRYTWQGEGPNPLQQRRASEAFHKKTRAMWQDRFLVRLKQIVEKGKE